MKVSDMFAAWSDHRPVCRGEGALGKGGWPERWAGLGVEDRAQLLAPEAGTPIQAGSTHSHCSQDLGSCIHLLIPLHLFSTFPVSGLR